MPARSTWMFRGQFRLLMATSLLRDAETRLTAEDEAGHRLRAWFAQRDVDRLRGAVDFYRDELARRNLWLSSSQWPQRPQVAAADLLRRVQPYLVIEGAGAAVARAPVVPRPQRLDTPAASGTSPRHARLAWTTAAGSILAWGATFFDIGSYGIGNRPFLIAMEVCALILSPVAIALNAPAARRHD